MRGAEALEDPTLGVVDARDQLVCLIELSVVHDVTPFLEPCERFRCRLLGDRAYVSMLRGHCQICGMSGSKRSTKPAMKSRNSIRAPLLASSSKKRSVSGPPIGTSGT